MARESSVRQRVGAIARWHRLILNAAKLPFSDFDHRHLNPSERGYATKVILIEFIERVKQATDVVQAKSLWFPQVLAGIFRPFLINSL